MLIIKTNLRNKKLHIHRHKKFRLVLDSAFAKTDAFPRLRKKANIAHAVHTLGLPYQAEDEEIYQKAIKQNRFVVTINFDDFRKLVQKDKAGVIGIPAHLSNERIDEILTNFLSDKNPDDYIGKAIRITEENTF